MRLVFFFVAIWLAAVSATSAEVQRVISVTGRGSVEMVPDMATISIGVQEQAQEAAEAMSAASRAVAAILTRLDAAGIAPRDVQTDNLSLQPVWSRSSTNNRDPRIIGFVARNTLTIRVRDLDILGATLDAVVQDGANTFNGLNFSVQDPEPAIARARAAAVKDAIARATQLADAAGVQLGPVQSISEQGGVVRPQMMEMAAARMASDVPVAQGEVSLATQVNMVFVIAEE